MKEKIWDVVVIGGGPAGMMAAGRAAERGLKVLLVEKNDGLGKKLLITGGGRCNVTNAELDNRKLLDNFKESSKYLHSPFSQYSVKDTLDFFHKRKMPTKVEALKRVFPVSDKAQSVWDVMVSYIKEGGVSVISNSPVKKINTDGSRVLSVETKTGKIFAKSFILATGGKSHPETGSTGDGFKWLKEIGHKVIEPSASLVPIAIKDDWVKELQGITLPDVKITIYQDGVKYKSSRGRLLFTHFGVSGPNILNLSSEIRELLKYGDVEIRVDLIPEMDFGMIDNKLQETFKENSRRKIENGLKGVILPSLAKHIVSISGIDSNKPCHDITREERVLLMKLLKAVPLKVKGLLGVKKAIVTSGGINLEEVDFKTMSSKKYPNLFVVGDILNIDRPSGGYSLQLCWTTGFVAGNSCEK